MILDKNWREKFLRSWTVRVTTVLALLNAIVASQAGVLYGALPFLPSSWRPIGAGLIVFFIVAVPIILTRLRAKPEG